MREEYEFFHNICLWSDIRIAKRLRYDSAATMWRMMGREKDKVRRVLEVGENGATV